MKFVVIDSLSGAHCELDAGSVDEAADKFALLQTPPSLVMMRASTQHNLPIPGSVTFMDEHSDAGYRGEHPLRSQVVIDVFER